ncbi:hypothetical protein SSP35_12_01470 [Streptomyces sp. NBRC 110611]|nr:hypothetical protein SSP35_12_01470 [Streptomyces sp. NBRC 110611]
MLVTVTRDGSSVRSTIDTPPSHRPGTAGPTDRPAPDCLPPRLTGLRPELTGRGPVPPATARSATPPDNDPIASGALRMRRAAAGQMLER